MRPSVLVTVPNTHWIHRHVVVTLLKLQLDRRYSLTIDVPANKPLENNQHHIVQQLLDGKWDFWLSIDADNPPRNNPLDLVDLDLDVVGLPTPIWHYTAKPGERPIYWNAYDWDEVAGAYREHIVRDGLQQVDAVGGGCMLIHRRVFEHPSLQHGAFLRTFNQNGTVEFGNDMAFCQRVQKAGFKVWCHFEYVCDHHCEVELNEVVAAMRGLYEVETV